MKHLIRRVIWSLVIALAVLVILAMVFMPTSPAPEWWRGYVPWPWR